MHSRWKLIVSVALSTGLVLPARANEKWFDEMRHGRYQDAIIEINKVIEKDPRNPNLYVNRSDLYSSLRQFPNAIADCTKAIEIDPKFWWAYQKRAFAYSETPQQYEAAMRDCAKCVEQTPKNPKNPGSYMNRALVELKFQKYSDAVADYTHAIDISPDNGAAYGWRAKAYSGMGKLELAQKDLDKASNLGYSDRGDYFSKNRR